MNNVLNSVREASISIACALDDPSDISIKDLEHIQKHITVIENFLEPFTIEELEEIIHD
tara:strand:+ start:846 stop:1022 length:177 start_codon:yes stop_codon:yes gene_type:complete